MGAVEVLSGWCMEHSTLEAGRIPDRYHHLCPGRWRTGVGVEQVCSCPNHGAAE